MKTRKSDHLRSVIAHVVLVILSFMCLFFFYILIINATRSHAFKGILNSLVVSGCSAAICTYFSALTAYGLYAYDFKLKKVAFTFIMAILVMPTQVTAMGFLRLVTIAIQ